MLCGVRHAIARKHHTRCNGFALECKSVLLSKWVLLRTQTFCTRAVRRPPLGLKFLQKHAEACGGRCLAKEYVSNNVKVSWECKHCHTWEACAFSVINRKSW
eukprot:TRINITY_DN15735_c2_g1_i2.p2 TRINITY_DN15735_c2_g1~~TRINITY_DN15735_c2_g1_i2.p2  ORF type:complete len:102 (-),score=6.01 TRINITY_DN15735_c2_g1_i2:366-671(-)